MALYFPVMSSIMYLTFFDYLREVNLGILRKNEKESFQIFFYVSIPCPRNMNVKINNCIICSFKESGKFDEMLFPLWYDSRFESVESGDVLYKRTVTVSFVYQFCLYMLSFRAINISLLIFSSNFFVTFE